jgi:hypothetical protein
MFYSTHGGKNEWMQSKLSNRNQCALKYRPALFSEMLTVTVDKSPITLKMAGSGI